MSNKSKYSFVVGSITFPFITVALFLLLFFLYRPSQASGSVFIVNNAADNDDGACNAANCTLREAIKAANSAAGEDAITFSLPPNTTITLAGTQLPPILDNLTIDGSTAVNLTISGNNTSRVLVVGPNPPAYPGYPIAPPNQPGGFGGGPNVTLINLTITKGNKANDRGGGIYTQGILTLQNCTISNSQSREGGIYNQGYLIIEDSTFVNNIGLSPASAGAGIYNDSDGTVNILNSSFISNTISAAGSLGGAAIYNFNGRVSISDSVFRGNVDTFVAAIRSRPLGRLTISNSIFSDNFFGRAVLSAGQTTITDSVFKDNNGGALYINAGFSTIDNTVFSGNASDFGGAVRIDSAVTVNINNSSFTGNSAGQEGGAIWSEGALDVTDSVFSDNSSNDSGGAIQSGVGGSLLVDGTTFDGNSADYGGAIQLYSGNGTVANSTISGNSAQFRGGGVHILGNMTIQNTTVTGNSAANGGGVYNTAALNIANSIFANSPSGGDCVNTGTFSTNITNLVEDGSCNPAFSGDPALSGLQNNGGPTWTHYPLPGSSVIDNGDAASCPDRDQRGISRPFDGNEDGTAVCDIGSVERVAIFVVNSANDVSNGICNASHCALREAIGAANVSYGTDLILFDIPGQGPHTIQPQSPLPNIAGPLLIDGYSQPGARENTLPGQPGGNAVLLIELDGTDAGSAASGLSLVKAFSHVSGLAINNFEQHGIRIVGPDAKGNVVAGNFIGADVNGNGSPGNGAANVFVGSGASSNIIGGDGPADGNIIAFAGSSGVIIDGVGSSGNEVRSNAVYSNTLLGIDLGQDGVTNNDAGDGDAGPNGLQNYPELFLATADFGRTIISGSLTSAASTGYTLEFFANSACDASGNGEGERPIGTANVVTDSGGEVAFEVSVPYETPLDKVISATATDPTGSSSEFSPCIAVINAPISGLVASNSSPTHYSLPTQLIATITTGGNVNYDWDFGDGESGVGRMVLHTYPAQGVFTAVVTAANTINTLTATTVITIIEPPPPTNVSLTLFGREWTAASGILWPVAVGVAVSALVVLALLGNRRRKRKGS